MCGCMPQAKPLQRKGRIAVSLYLCRTQMCLHKTVFTLCFPAFDLMKGTVGINYYKLKCCNNDRAFWISLT